MSILDIGGGFQDSNFEPMAAGLRLSLDQAFSDRNATFIGEPGRFYAAPYYTMVCRVIARRKQIGYARSGQIPDMLYQNDGVYGCFSCKWSEDGVYTPIHLPHGGQTDGRQKKGKHRYSIWGPTCDSVDLVAEEIVFSSEVRVGDWLKYPNMGGEWPSLPARICAHSLLAYTTSASSQFNGFPNRYCVIYRD